MILSKEQRESFNEASKPLIKWMNERLHPHAYVIVDQTGSELVEGVVSFRTEEYLKD